MAGEAGGTKVLTPDLFATYFAQAHDRKSSGRQLLLQCENRSTGSEEVGHLRANGCVASVAGQSRMRQGPVSAIQSTSEAVSPLSEFVFRHGRAQYLPLARERRFPGEFHLASAARFGAFFQGKWPSWPPKPKFFSGWLAELGDRRFPVKSATLT